jgi:aryl-alcohol dehydrogenase-like predicted oxidoreductase
MHARCRRLASCRHAYVALLSQPVVVPVLGAMEFGRAPSKQLCEAMTREFVDRGWDLVDTASYYSFGESERFLGGFDQKLQAKAPSVDLSRRFHCLTALLFAALQLRIATKANPLFTDRPTMKGLTKESVYNQLVESLKNLNAKDVDIFYLVRCSSFLHESRLLTHSLSVPGCLQHIPDHSTPIEETLTAVDKLYKGAEHNARCLPSFTVR